MAILESLETAIGGSSLGLLEEEALGVGIDDGEVFVKGGCGARVIDIEGGDGDGDGDERRAGTVGPTEEAVARGGVASPSSPSSPSSPYVCQGREPAQGVSPDDPTSWLMSADDGENVDRNVSGDAPPAKPCVAKPSRLKPPSEKMDFFASKKKEKPTGASAMKAATTTAVAATTSERGADASEQEDSPFTKRIKELERNPEKAFAGGSKLRCDGDKDDGNGGNGGVVGHQQRKKKKTAAEIQWESWGTDGQLF